MLSFRIGFSLVSPTVVCAFLEMISGLDPSSVTTEPRYLKQDTVSKSIRTDLRGDAVGVVRVISLVFSALISIPKEAEVCWLAPPAPVLLLLSLRYHLQSVGLLLPFLRC